MQRRNNLIEMRKLAKEKGIHNLTLLVSVNLLNYMPYKKALSTASWIMNDNKHGTIHEVANPFVITGYLMTCKAKPELFGRIWKSILDNSYIEREKCFFDIYNKKYQKRKKCGLIVNILEHETGKKSYSPGLEYDAMLYEKQLKINNIDVEYISPYKYKKKLSVDFLIGFEEIGNIDLINKIKIWKTGNRHVFLVPNLEVMQNRLKWKDTIENINLIDFIVAKTRGLQPLISKVFPNTKVILIPHTSIIKGNITNINNRSEIIHFAGSSPFKNTLESVKAGINIMDKYNYTKFNIVIVSWPKGYAIPKNELDEIRNIKDNRINLYIENGYLSEEDKIILYNRSSLAICCSNAEGFGHYILEAAAYGCQVLTTNASPMKDILTIKGTFSLAEFSNERNHNLGKYYTIPSENIFKAMESLSIWNPIECRKNYKLRQNMFENNFNILIKSLSNKPLNKLLSNKPLNKSLSNKPLNKSLSNKPSNKSLSNKTLLNIPLKNAYVFLVMKGDNYITGAMVAAHSIHMTNFNRQNIDLVCMVTPDVSDIGVNYLNRVFDHVIKVEYLSFNSKNMKTKKQDILYNEWINDSYTKWNCLKFTNYNKVLFIDADKVILRNIDSLFELQAPAGTFSSPWAKPFAIKGMYNPYNNIKHGNIVSYKKIQEGLNKNSFVMVGTCILLKPNLNDFNQYIERVKRLQPFGYKTCFSMMDEQSLADYYVSKKINWTMIHQRYNMIPWHKKWLGSNNVPYIFHYFNKKPWNVEPNLMYHDNQIWWNLYQHMLSKLTKGVLMIPFEGEKGCFWCCKLDHNAFKEGRICCKLL
jgi:glycosyltransferase involved in cell wall biosynthesis